MKVRAMWLLSLAVTAAHAQPAGVKPNPETLRRNASALLAQAQNNRTHGAWANAERLYQQQITPPQVR